ncbi:MAG: hypothetical protein ACRDRH_03180 [Pseudonocardia sp.]
MRAAAAVEPAPAVLPVEPPCDACLGPVRFDPCTRRFSHTGPTSCRGIDDLILDVPRREWEDLRRLRSGGTS